MGNSAKRDAKKYDIATRQRKALELRKGGATYDGIARMLGLADRSGARKDVQNALLAIIEEPAKEVLALELSRLDSLVLGLWASAKKGDVQAVDRVIRIMDRRAKYLGLDSPEKHEHSGRDGGPVHVEVTHEELLAKLDRLAEVRAIEAGDSDDEDSDDDE